MQAPPLRLSFSKRQYRAWDSLAGDEAQ